MKVGHSFNCFTRWIAVWRRRVVCVCAGVCMHVCTSSYMQPSHIHYWSWSCIITQCFAPSRQKHPFIGISHLSYWVVTSQPHPHPTPLAHTHSCTPLYATKINMTCGLICMLSVLCTMSQTLCASYSALNCTIYQLPVDSVHVEILFHY